MSKRHVERSAKARARPNLYDVDSEGKLTLHLHSGQISVWNSDSRFTFVFAGTQSGKTSFAPFWLYRQIRDTYVTGEDNTYLAVTSTYDLFKMKFRPEMISVFCKVLNIGRYWAADRIIELKSLDPDDDRYMEFYAKRAVDPMWGRIVLRSAQSKGGLESATAKACVMDECGMEEFSVQAWRAIRRRLSLERGRVLGITTLYFFGWLYNIYQGWLNGERSDVDIIQFPSYINPRFDMEEYEDARKEMPDDEFSMTYQGEFHRPSTLIYKDFHPSMLIDGSDPPIEWERVVGIDFGGANVAALFLAYNPHKGHWIAYDELLMGHDTTQNYADNVNQHLAGCSNVTVIGGAKSEDQFRRDWHAADLYVEEPLIYDLEPGITRGISLIKKDKLRVCRDVRGLRAEFDSYRRKPDDDGNPTEQIINKARYHRLDAYRYACTWIEDEPPGVDVMTYQDLLEGKELVHA